ncbi:MAG: hypothetical protein ACTSRU_21060 [Candidatus Hodarchaeales archaeon]
MPERAEKLIFRAEKIHSIRYDAEFPHDDTTCLKSVYITRSGLKALIGGTAIPQEVTVKIETS